MSPAAKKQKKTFLTAALIDSSPLYLCEEHTPHLYERERERVGGGGAEGAIARRGLQGRSLRLNVGQASARAGTHNGV